MKYFGKISLENYNLRFSATDLSNDDITPNAGLNRKTFSLNAGAVLADKLTLNVSGKYIIEEVNNRPRTSDSPGNGNFTVALSPPNIDINNYKPGFNEDGTEFLIFRTNIIRTLIGLLIDLAMKAIKIDL